MSSQFEHLKNWLLNSGLCVFQKNDPQYGGVHSFYDIKEQKFGFLYPEITGYYISTMRFLYSDEKKEQYLEHAKASADWLIKIYKKYGTIVQGISSEPSQQNYAYSFDISICAKGLLDYYMMSNDELYLSHAKEILEPVIGGALEQDGTILPFRNLDSEKFQQSYDVWYRQKGCLHIKNAMTFCQLYKILNEKIFLEYAEKICNVFSIYQNNDGSFLLHENQKTINLHTMCYALEGLLFSFSVNKNENYLKSCIAAVNWCKEKLQDDGSIELWFNSKHRSKASYPTAQLLRIVLLLDKLSQNRQYEDLAKKLYDHLLSYQISNPHLEQNGALLEENYRTILGWKMRQKLNSWGSMFALQALYWYDNFDRISFDKQIELLF